MCHQQRTPNRNGPSRSRKSFVSPMAPGVSPILHYCRKREHSRPLAAGELIYQLFRLDIFDFVRTRIKRSEERGVGKGAVCTCRTRWARYDKKKNNREMKTNSTTLI